jgi:acetyl esterase/lipase
MAGLFYRRALICGVAGVAFGAEIRKATHVYKTAGGVKIQADVYRADDDALRPVLVWIHGGALIMGHREGVSERVKRWALEAGYVLVSIDYRLAPETQLPEIARDVEDAFEWIRADGRRLFRGDTGRIAVAGGSAGGYLTLLTGYRVKPRPTVLLSLWGYGDLIGDWYSTPSRHARHHTGKMTREEAYAQVRGPAVADARDRKGNGGGFYQYCRQTGTWPKAVSGWDPKREGEKFYPYMPVRNVTGEYPPTFLIHGTADTDVPYEQSALMAGEFTKRGVRHELAPVPGAEHGLAGGGAKLVEAAYGRAFAFVDKAMGR